MHYAFETDNHPHKKRVQAKVRGLRNICKGISIKNNEKKNYVEEKNKDMAPHASEEKYRKTVV